MDVFKRPAVVSGQGVYLVALKDRKEAEDGRYFYSLELIDPTP